tara:strand:- start:298 stop:639 length:342 start_codon:yes stop_codon:yes gene_type:complete
LTQLIVSKAAFGGPYGPVARRSFFDQNSGGSDHHRGLVRKFRFGVWAEHLPDFIWFKGLCERFAPAAAGTVLQQREAIAVGFSRLSSPFRFVEGITEIEPEQAITWSLFERFG